LEKKEMGHSCLQTQSAIKKKAYHKGITKIQGAACFVASQDIRKHKVVVEKENQAIVNFFQK
jgi:hypothetical protein